MNVKRYNNFTEFHNDFNPELSRSGNKRVVQFHQVVGSLHQGCGCTRRQRNQWCSKEYRAIGQVLSPENVQLMKMKYPLTKFEFAEGDGVFHVIEP